MIGGDILKELYKIIYQNYHLTIDDFELQVDEDFWTNDEVISELCGDTVITSLPKIYELLQAFKEAKIGTDFLIKEYISLEDVELIDFSNTDFRKRNRAFSFSDAEFGYLSLSKLLKIDPLSSIDETSQEYRTLIDYISTAISKGENAKVSQILSHIENSNIEWGILVHKIIHTNTTLSIYSYLYYKELLRGGKIELDQNLDYSIPHGVTAPLIANTKYEQYFEVFDILNELNHATDTVTRFLKLYHIIEYLVYRKELVEIEQKARNNRTFIREIHGLSNQGTKELEVLRRNFKKIFEAEVLAGYFNINPLSANEANFLRNYWGIAIPASNVLEHTVVNRIADLVYKIRNSIVHSKESEFHITTSNPEDYADVLQLLKRFINLLEIQILKKISSNDISISYQSQYIELY